MGFVSCYCRILFYQRHLFSKALVENWRLPCAIHSASYILIQTSIFLISKYIFKMKCAFHYTLIPSGSSKTDGGRFGANFETFKCPMPLTYTVQISNNSESPYASNFFEFPNKSSTSPKPIFLQSDWIHSWNIMLKFAIVIWLKITSW